MANKVGFIIQMQDRFSSVARKIDSASKRMSKNISKVGKQSLRTSAIFQKSSAVMKSSVVRLGAVIASIATAGGILSSGGKFQDAMADLQAITGAAGKDLDFLSGSALSMGKSFAISQDQVATGFKLVASAKPELLSNTEALRDMTKQVLLLSTAGGIELAEAAKVTAVGLNAFGKSAGEAGKFVNILAAGSKFGSSEIAQTGEAMKIAAPAARDAGLSFLDLNASIQAVARGGIFASQAGTALSAIFGRLRRLGINVKDVGLEQTFTLIGESLNKATSDQERALLSAKLFGEEHGKVGLALVSNAKLLSQFQTDLKGTNVAQEQANIRLGTFNARMRRLKITIQDSMIKAFVRLEPILTKQAENLTNFFDSLKKESVIEFADSVSILVNAFAGLVDILGKALGLLKSVGVFLGENAARVVISAESASLTSGLKSLGGQSGRNARIRGLREDIQKQEEAALSITSGLRGAGGRFGRNARSKIITGGEVLQPKRGGAISQESSIAKESKTDLNINIKAPRDTVKSISRKDQGAASGLNIGVNMEAAL